MFGVSNMLFIVFAGLGAMLTAIPFPKAVASGNVGTSMVIIWTEFTCVLQFANAICWNKSIENWAPTWCDFCSHFLIAVDVALTGCSVSINRHLYMIVTLDSKRHERTFNAIVDTVLCLVFPLVSIALAYVVQQYRYYIYEDLGCLPGVASVNLAFPLVWMLPLLMGDVSAVYSSLIIREIFRRNHKAMEESGTNLAWSRRSMAIAIVSGMYGLIPTSTAIVLLVTAYPVAPWPGWNIIHSTIGDVAYVPAQTWKTTTTIAMLELRRWTVVSLAIVIFAFLGFTADVKKMYWIPCRTANRDFPVEQARTVLDQIVDVHLNDHLDCVQGFFSDG